LFRFDRKIKSFTDKQKLREFSTTTTKGVTTDIARTALVPYNKFFLNNSSENIKELAEAIYKFNHSVELQEKFPEVFSGKYNNLLTYTKSKKS